MNISSTTQLIELSEKALDCILYGDFVKARLVCSQTIKRSGEFFN